MNLWLPKRKGIVRDSSHVQQVVYTLLNLKCITSKDLLLYNGTPVSVMCQPGCEEGWGEIYMYMCG